MSLLNKLKKVSLPVALLAGMSLSGCGVSPQPVSPCEATLYTKSTGFLGEDIGLGQYKLGIPDTSSPLKWGFDYFDGHKGGTGDTLQFVGCDDSVFFRFAYGKLANIVLTNNWQGETDTGLKLGDSVEKFLELYPNATSNTGSTSNSRWVSGNFFINSDNNSVIRSMELISYK